MTLMRHGCERVLYVDFDAHHGDGVEDAFYEEPRVTTVSIHDRNRWPFSGTHSHAHAGAYNFPVPHGLNDTEFHYIVQNAVLPIARAIELDALVVCCGADCLAGDPLSYMELSNTALWDTVDELIDFGVPTIVLGGGGYNPWTVTRYWAGMWGRISGRDLPERLPPEVTEYMRGMECDLIDEEDVQESWLTTMADTPYPGPVRDEIELMVANVEDQFQRI